MTRPLVMGVVNVTPDSFSDGGRYCDVSAAVAHGHALVKEGADLLDIGGESTRPGASPTSERDEIERVVPVIEALSGAVRTPLSVDTRRPAVARAAVGRGAEIWNDVEALATPQARQTAAELGCRVILMHMRGDPATMQDDPRYEDVVGEVSDFLAARAEAAVAAGVRPDRLMLDPGIGFGKRLEHNLALLAGLDRLSALGFPLVLGVSRKRFIQALDPMAGSPADRLGGSIAGALIGARAGVAMVRVHDVRQTVQALTVFDAVDGLARPSDRA